MSPLPPTPRYAENATSTAWMNPARSLAILFVVAIHSVSATVETDLSSHGDATWWSANLIDATARWSVPVFLMISGALALDPDRGVRPREFLIKRFYRIGIPLVVWTIVYILFRLFYEGRIHTTWSPIAAILTGSPYVQLYFLYVLAGLILLTPFMRLLSLHGTKRLQWGTAGILLAIGMADHVISTFFDVGEPNAATRFLPLMGYYVLGFVLRDWILTRKQTILAWLVFLASYSAILAWSAIGPGDRPWRFAYEYVSPFVVPMSLAAYVLLHTHMRTGWRFLTRIYPYSFGVFLLHPLILFPMRQVIGHPNTVGSVLFHGLVLPIIYTLICTAITWLMLKIPFVRGAFGAGKPFLTRG